MIDHDSLTAWHLDHAWMHDPAAGQPSGTIDYSEDTMSDPTTTTTQYRVRYANGQAVAGDAPFRSRADAQGWVDGFVANHVEPKPAMNILEEAVPVPAKTRTITLTDRPPVKIREDEWPVIAVGDADDDDSDGRGNQPNREWTRTIRVRQHEDGRAIVYGTYDYSTCFQGEKGAAARRGILLAATTTDSIIAAIRSVGADLADAEGDAPDNWREAIQACIADLPAEAI